MLEVISLNFTGADVRKDREAMPEGIEVTVTIDSVTQQSEEEVMLGFTYAVDYKPDIGAVSISGEVLCQDTPPNVEKVVKAFQKDKAFPPELGTNVLNMINANASINCIFVIRPFNLLPPFTPPLMEAGEEKREEKK